MFKEEGNLDAALAYYKEAVNLTPNFADAHSNLGNVYRALHRSEEALAAYKDSIRLRPEFAAAYGNLGACYLDLKMVPEGSSTNVY